jgi:hypothetical protein
MAELKVTAAKGDRFDGGCRPLAPDQLACTLQPTSIIR